MANRVPLIVDTTNLHLKELPLGDALDLTGCGIVGLTSFTPGTGGGFRFVGVTTFGMGLGIATVFVNDGLRANYLLASNLTDNQVVTAGVGGSITSSSKLTFDETTFALTGKGTVSNDFRVSGLTSTTNFEAVGVSSIGTLYVHNNRVGLTTTLDLWVTGVTTATGAVTINDATGSTDKDTGALIVEGGVGVEENLHIGGNVVVQGNIDAKGSLNYTNVTDIYSVGIITANGGIKVTAGFVTCSATDNSTSPTTGVLQVSGGVGIASNLNVGLEVKSEDLNITGISTLNDTKVGGGLTVTGATDLDSTLEVDSTSTFNNDVNLIGVNAGVTSAYWDKSANEFKFIDNTKLSIGTGQDLTFYHNGSNSYLENDNGNLIIDNSNGVDMYINSGNDIFIRPQGTENGIKVIGDGAVELYHNALIRVGTTTEGVDVTGTGALKIPVGTTDYRPTSASDGDIRFNSTTNSYEGYGNGAWGGLGGGTEIDNTIATTSATGVGTFTKASYRSASIRAQIDQGGSYQVGRYLLIHDGTTVTVVEEAAIATGSMLGSFDGVINGSNVEFKVTMVSAGIATVTTIIDKISV